MMTSVSAVEPARPTILVVTTATAIPVAVAAPICRPTFIETTRTTVAVSTVVRPTAAPRVLVETRTASIGHALDHSVATDQPGLAECERSRIRCARKTKSSSNHCGNSQNLRAYHDLNLVSARHPLRPTGEIEGCASFAEPMLTHARSFRSVDLGSANREHHT